MASPLTTGQGPAIINCSIAFLIIAYILVFLRLWSRQILKRSFYFHDFFIICGLLLSTGLVAMMILNVKYGGLGQRGAQLMLEPETYIQKLTYFGKILVAVQPAWAAAMTCIRVSILNLYAHIFSASRRFTYVCWAVAVLAVLWFPGELIAAFLACQPLSFNWDSSVPGGHCGNVSAAYITMHASNVFIDVTIALLPAPILWGLQMKASKRIAVIFMFSLGALICAISVSRIALYQRVDLKSPDFTYDAGILFLFTALEPLLAISLACMPLLRPFGEKIANSSAVSWVRSVTSSITASKGTSLHSMETGKPTHDGSESLSLNSYPSRPNMPSRKAGTRIVVTSEVEQNYEPHLGGMKEQV